VLIELTRPEMTKETRTLHEIDQKQSKFAPEGSEVTYTFATPLHQRHRRQRRQADENPKTSAVDIAE